MNLTKAQFENMFDQKSNKDLIVIMCPTLSDYPEKPKNQSHCDLFDCPKCKEKMWLSQKKKGALMFATALNHEILLACSYCIKDLVKEIPEYFINPQRIDL